MSDLVMLRVGLALIDDARRGGGFETDEAKLADRVEEILTALGAAGANPHGLIVTATPRGAEQVHLSTPTSEHGSSDAVLRSDGVLLQQYTMIGLAAAPVDLEELTPEQEEEMRRAMARYEAIINRPRFRGRRFLRALTCDRQPGAEVQLIAVEIFDDGLVVHYSFEQTQEEFEALIDGDPWDEDHLGLRVEDDLGTEYRRFGGGSLSAGVVRSSYSFTPAVPAAARTLRVTTRSSSVELHLQN